MATNSSTLARKSHGQRSLVGYSPWDQKRVGCNSVTKQTRSIWDLSSLTRGSNPCLLKHGILTTGPLSCKLLKLIFSSFLLSTLSG